MGVCSLKSGDWKIDSHVFPKVWGIKPMVDGGGRLGWFGGGGGAAWGSSLDLNGAAWFRRSEGP